MPDAALALKSRQEAQTSLAERETKSAV